jgi:hypothetical protein
MKRITLELGGKSPTILLDDANFEEAIPTALGIALSNSGQGCAAGTRLLVPGSDSRPLSGRSQMPCTPSLSAIRPIPRSLSDPWCRRGSTSACNLHPQGH